MVKITFKNKYTGETETVQLVKTQYTSNNRLAIAANCEDGEPYGVITVNIEDAFIAPDEIILDTNNISEDLFTQLFKKEYLVKTRRNVRSGFCTYPVVKVTNKFLRDLDE